MNEFKEILVNRIAPNPDNPRKHFSGPGFEELVKSIESKGVIEPVIVRAISKDPYIFEIVAGDRRLRALKRIDNGKGKARIPAIIRDLTDGEAFEFMMIENLQREDLTELEEAQSFKQYLEKRGKDQLQELAARTGIQPAYIRRRIAILSLPKYLLAAWDKNELVFGHLEQFLRIRDPKRIKKIHSDLWRWGQGPSVNDLKEQINKQAPQLGWARFNLETEGCLGCENNSDVQKALFDIDGSKKAVCFNPDCFKKKQKKGIDQYWKKDQEKFGTAGWKFKEDLDWSYRHSFYHGDKFEKCQTCDDFCTLFSIKGQVEDEKVCTAGSAKCQAALRRALEQKKEAKATKKGKKGQLKAPRVEWHGRHFREQFYKTSIPERIQTLDPFHDKAAQLILYAILKQENGLREWYLQKVGILKPTQDLWRLADGSEKLWKHILSLQPVDVKGAMVEVAGQVLMSWALQPAERVMIAEYLGIDLKKEWTITAEYLQKKTIKEMLAFGKTSGIFADPKAKEYLAGQIKKDKYESCKKSELINVFLKSGIELKGKVPDEILKGTK